MASVPAMAQAYFATTARYLSGNHRIALRAEIVRELVGDGLNSILDLGCGNGAVAAVLNGPKTLVDNSPAMVSEGRKVGRAICADLHDFTGQFDLVLCIGILAHTGDTEETLAAVARNMKPGGRCVIQFSAAERWINRVAALMFALAGRHYRETPRREVMSAAARLGLQPVAERSHLLLLPGMQRLLGQWIVPYDRLTRRFGYGLDTLVMFERGVIIHRVPTRLVRRASRRGHSSRNGGQAPDLSAD
jgi:SAM-dependent methyltransferase